MRQKIRHSLPNCVNPVALQPCGGARLCRTVALLSVLSIGSSGLQAQVLNPQPALEQLGPITRPVEGVADSLLKRSGEIDASVDTLDRASDGVVEGLDPLGELPVQLPVVNMSGTTAFMDVIVEDGWRAVDRQWLVMLQPGELASLEALNIEILEQTDFADLGMRLLRFRVPDELNSREALRQVLPSPLVERFDRNHIYNPQTATAQTTSADGRPGAICDQPLKIGMVDTAIQIDHPAFTGRKIIEKDFLGETIEQPHAHGTAVAGLLVGSDGQLPPRLPQATLYNASVFYARNQYAQGATMMHLVRGLNWLVQEDVSVINMSLAGPDNQVLAAVVATIIARGKVIVAAAGNEGPAAPPLYPAAYEDVISATAVDDNARVYRWANRGGHVDFAARGVSVLTARSDGEFGRESGTSMAAPIVSAFVACELLDNQGQISAAIASLANKAVDLGDLGRDPVFGFGLLK